jgi:hypothetical protein
MASAPPWSNRHSAEVNCLCLSKPVALGIKNQEKNIALSGHLNMHFTKITRVVRRQPPHSIAGLWW